jgi:hypothetical protein
MATTSTFTFGVYPSSMEDGDPFEAFLLDVPVITHRGDGSTAEDAAARRAWWSAFHLLGPRGIEPEEFLVCCWRNGAPGPGVDSRGIVQ